MAQLIGGSYCGRGRGMSGEINDRGMKLLLLSYGKMCGFPNSLVFRYSTCVEGEWSGMAHSDEGWASCISCEVHAIESQAVPLAAIFQ